MNYIAAGADPEKTENIRGEIPIFQRSLLPTPLGPPQKLCCFHITNFPKKPTAGEIFIETGFSVSYLHHDGISIVHWVAQHCLEQHISQNISSQLRLILRAKRGNFFHKRLEMAKKGESRKNQFLKLLEPIFCSSGAPILKFCDTIRPNGCSMGMYDRECKG